MSDERLTRIEETLAHQSATIDELSEVISRQEAQITQLSRRLGLLMERAAEAELAAGGTVPLGDQTPPHY